MSERNPRHRWRHAGSNVGAYGQEVSETITHVRALEIATGKVLDLSNSDCGFSYRSSIFNSTRRNEFIVLQVSYRLCRNSEPKIEYADVKNFFAANKVEKPTLQQVRDAVRSIRQSKAMLLVEGDEDCRSAGSFFKNPIVSATRQYASRLSPRSSPSRTPAPLSFSRRQSKDRGSMAGGAGWISQRLHSWACRDLAQTFSGHREPRRRNRNRYSRPQRPNREKGIRYLGGIVAAGAGVCGVLKQSDSRNILRAVRMSSLT